MIQNRNNNAESIIQKSRIFTIQQDFANGPEHFSEEKEENADVSIPYAPLPLRPLMQF